MKLAYLTYEEAYKALLNGYFIARKAWDSTGEYLWLLEAATIPVDWCKDPHLRHLATMNGGKLECLASIRMKTSEGKVLTGWNPDLTDQLASDWRIIFPLAGHECPCCDP